MNNNRFKPFSTTLMGSMPRSKELLDLKEKSIKDDKYAEEYKEKVYSETEKIIQMSEEIGIDVVVSGELARDNYMSYIAEHVPGVKLMTMEDIKEITGNTEEFNKSLEEMDAADNTMNSPVCVDRISTDIELNTEEVDMIKKFSKKPFKMTSPSPYLLTRSMWMKEITGRVYSDRKELGNDVVKLLINEIRRLVEMGAGIIQIDEPILSEVVFTRKKGDNSFYWGALSEKIKVDRELKFVNELLAPVFAELRKHENVLGAMHVCRGNWTCDETVLLEGAYDRLGQFFDSLDVDMLALEFSTSRAGEVKQLFSNNFLDKKIMLGFGCLNPRNTIVETPEQIVKATEKVLDFLPPEKIWLNPDCGFATFSKRPLNSYEIIKQKMSSMVEASHILRERYCK